MTIEISLLWPALLAGLLVTATHVPLGIQVLSRGIVFIDLAVAQFAGLGVIFADWLGFEPRGLGVQAAALGAALAGALALNWTDKHWPETQEAVIGVSFIVAANLAILLLAANPHGGEHLKDLLIGQILWVRPADLLPVAVLSAAIVAAWFGAGPRMGRIGFYLLFACAVTLAVQLVGVYLVFATLIVPALATRRMDGPPREKPRGTAGSRRLAACYLLGATGYATGLALSIASDLPPGPLIVCAMTGLGIALFLSFPRRAPT